ncbi:HAMP domain-containing sensor histidine kinase [Pleomorphomonas sp. NRK KF1]|uniref:sensor histidine kinase n=1 Tax=Pleomorphomonas sp. NRK KF1 TaxID=2943000 RepID=UPI0020446B9A|nr:ATP-binding protein [Pleomorphomonas sp. NRK KF1]MCM5553355.1 ATP-binding protein [Pleomorphomonas sp. NRK KF1]
MPRLFVKFTVVIWLTLAVSITTFIHVVNQIQAPPFVSKLERQKREVVLDLTESILVADGEDAARRFMSVSESTLPLGLTLSSINGADSCSADDTQEMRRVKSGKDCYQISVAKYRGIIPDGLAPIILWLAMLISSMLSAAILARYLIRPVVQLRDGLSALAHGRFDVRIGGKPRARKDEITTLAHDFDSTAARLQELQDAQQRLFHDVSHELRSPLSRLQAVVGVLRQSPAKLGTMLDRMDREIERLDMLVGEVLTLARSTVKSNLPLKTQTVDVIDLLNEILGDAAFEAQARGISIATSIDSTFPAEVEGELIYRALENVIRNAIKYTADGSMVSVHCETGQDRLTLCIEDRGPGVSQDELERIFQPFSRGNGVEARGGYGLGLAIARQAVERHGGRIYASLPKEGGLAITLELPRRPST